MSFFHSKQVRLSRRDYLRLLQHIEQMQEQMKAIKMELTRLVGPVEYPEANIEYEIRSEHE